MITPKETAKFKSTFKDNNGTVTVNMEEEQISYSGVQ